MFVSNGFPRNRRHGRKAPNIYWKRLYSLGERLLELLDGKRRRTTTKHCSIIQRQLKRNRWNKNNKCVEDSKNDTMGRGWAHNNNVEEQTTGRRTDFMDARRQALLHLAACGAVLS